MQVLPFLLLSQVPIDSWANYYISPTWISVKQAYFPYESLLNHLFGVKTRVRSRANLTRLILLKWYEAIEVIWLIDHAGTHGNHCRIHRSVRQFLDPDSMQWQMFSTSANCTGRTSSSQLPHGHPKNQWMYGNPSDGIGPIRDLRNWNSCDAPAASCAVPCDSVSGRYCLKGLEKIGGLGATWISNGWSWIARDQAKWGSWCCSAAFGWLCNMVWNLKPGGLLSSDWSKYWLQFANTECALRNTSWYLEHSHFGQDNLLQHNATYHCHWRYYCNQCPFFGGKRVQDLRLGQEVCCR